MTEVDGDLEGDAREALREHLLRAALTGRQRHAPFRTLEGMQALLADRDVVRFPVEVVFDETPLHEGEFAWADLTGATPAEGYRLALHPFFEGHASAIPLLIAYHIPSINYGPIVSSHDAEAFGAELLDLDVEAYYQRLCSLADAIPR